MQHSLMDNEYLTICDISKQKERYSNKGKNLMEKFKISIILTKQHRQNEGKYNEMCLKFRDGSFTVKDHLELQKRAYDVLPLEQKKQIEDNGTRLVTTNKQAGNYNAKKLVETVKRSGNKIFRLQAQETGMTGKVTTTAENFSGLKSIIHITIGSRVMLTSNLWVEAGLINGAQGKVEDIVFEEESADPLPKYVLVSFDDYNGPPLFKDKKINDRSIENWVPIFKITRRHQYKGNVERTQIPLRLSSAMTGHKVQGLSLYNGAIVQYPTKDESKRDPMATWGLNYCMLTRVPDIKKIGFINLPDYDRHMKLYHKTKGRKDYFTLFQNFDKKANLEFERFVNTCANINVNQLKYAKEKYKLLPINFHRIFHEENECSKQNLSTTFQKIPTQTMEAIYETTSGTSKERNMQSNLLSAKKKNTFSVPVDPKGVAQQPSCNLTPPIVLPDLHRLPANVKQSKKKAQLHAFKDHNLSQPFKRDTPSTARHEVQEQYITETLILPQFENPNGNHCWLNSVIHLIIHALHNQGEMGNDTIIETLKEDLLPIGYALLECFRRFSVPGRYNVGLSIADPTVGHHKQIPLKHLMLKAMDVVNSPYELERQHDAGECLISLLEISRELSFLWHHIKVNVKCDNSDRLHDRDKDEINSIASIELTNLVKRTRQGNQRFSGKDAIKKYFESTEHGILLNCDVCHATSCSKQFKLLGSSKFIIVQFLRFKVVDQRNLRNRRVLISKIVAESDPFSFVDISTSQGVQSFQVIATIEHIGNSKDSGHYISYIYKNGIWYKCDDTSVTALEKEDEAPTKKPYIMLLKLNA